MPLHTKKLIVYIDQNIISNVVKVKADRTRRPDLIALFDVLHTGMMDEKLVCPRSWFHREEGSLTPLDADIQRYLRNIGQVDFLPPFQLEKNQFLNAACAFLGIEPHSPNWNVCLSSDPDARMRRFCLDANMSMSILSLREGRRQHADALARNRVLVQGRTYAEQLSIERSAVPSYLHGLYGDAAKQMFLGRVRGVEEYGRFLGTDLATSVVSMDILGRLFASLLVHHNHRPVQTGDATDMKILSNLLPYCHVITTDKFMKEVVCALKLDERFGVTVFSGTAEDIVALTRYLDDMLATRPPANVPQLTLLVAPDTLIKEHLWDFFRSLMRAARRRSEELDEWVELVNINDGDYPEYRHPQSGILLTPSFFFEFDNEIRSKGRDVSDIAREGRAESTVIVDSYHELPVGFLSDVFAALSSGATSVPKYGWRIVRRQ